MGNYINYLNYLDILLCTYKDKKIICIKQINLLIVDRNYEVKSVAPSLFSFIVREVIRSFGLLLEYYQL